MVLRHFNDRESMTHEAAQVALRKANLVYESERLEHRSNNALGRTEIQVANKDLFHLPPSTRKAGISGQVTPTSNWLTVGISIHQYKQICARMFSDVTV